MSMSEGFAWGRGVGSIMTCINSFWKNFTVSIIDFLLRVSSVRLIVFRTGNGAAHPDAIIPPADTHVGKVCETKGFHSVMV